MAIRHKSFWDYAEERGRSYFEGTRTRGSGCGAEKSDVTQKDIVTRGKYTTTIDREGGYRTEVKSTVGLILTIKGEWFPKIAQEAANRQQIPALYFAIKDRGYFALKPTDKEEMDPALPVLTVRYSTGVTAEELRKYIKGYIVVDTSVYAKTLPRYRYLYWTIEEDQRLL